MKETSILSALMAHGAEDWLPMHMPGHKRSAAMLAAGLPWGLDVTEVGPFDALHAPDGLLKRAMDRAAECYGARRTFYLVNGSSGGLLAAIRAMAAPGGRAVVAQNSHMSVYHALELCGLMPSYIAPRVDVAFGAAGGIDPLDVAAALDAAPGAKLVVITSPTYEGSISDVRAIADVAHARGAALLVDEAHGAHLPFSDRFPASAMHLGADVVVQSVHKLLPGLTQTALLHVMTDRANAREIQRQLAIFETSSPSFVLLASIDECVQLMARDGAALLGAHRERLDVFSDAMRRLTHLRVRGCGCDGPHPEAHALDPAKLLISTADAALTGGALASRLRDEHRILLEMSMGDSALAISTVCDPPGALEHLAGALLGIDAELASAPRRAALALDVPPMLQRMPIGEALAREGRFAPLNRAVGQVSLEYVWAYPPGVPLLAPGAAVSEAALERIEALIRGGARLHSTQGRLPGALRVC